MGPETFAGLAPAVLRRVIPSGASGSASSLPATSPSRHRHRPGLPLPLQRQIPGRARTAPTERPSGAASPPIPPLRGAPSRVEGARPPTGSRGLLVRVQHRFVTGARRSEPLHEGKFESPSRVPARSAQVRDEGLPHAHVREKPRPHAVGSRRAASSCCRDRGPLPQRRSRFGLRAGDSCSRARRAPGQRAHGVGSRREGGLPDPGAVVRPAPSPAGDRAYDAPARLPRGRGSGLPPRAVGRQGAMGDRPDEARGQGLDRARRKPRTELRPPGA